MGTVFEANARTSLAMKKIILSLLVIVSTSLGWSQQMDRQNKSIPIPAEETKEKDSTTIPFQIKPEERKIDLSPKSMEGSAFKKPVEITEEKKGFSMLDKSTLLDPGEKYERRINQKAVEQGYKIAPMSDQFLGEFRSNGKFVNIMCRDHEYPDGDLVRVFVNGDIYVPSLLLVSGYRGFNIPLNPGVNQIDFLALNQGESGPNTAEFVVYDDEGNLVSSKKWNLLTGVKATIIVYKKEEKEKEGQ